MYATKYTQIFQKIKENKLEILLPKIKTPLKNEAAPKVIHFPTFYDRFFE